MGRTEEGCIGWFSKLGDLPCLATHVLLPCSGSRLSTTTCLFFSAKSAANLGPVSRNIDIHNTTVRSRRPSPLEDPLGVFGEKTTAESLSNGVIEGHGLLKGLHSS